MCVCASHWLMRVVRCEAGQRVMSRAQACRAAVCSGEVPAFTVGITPSPRGYTQLNTLSRWPRDLRRSWTHIWQQYT